MPDIIEKYHFTLDHPSLKGHFPGNPVIPGVVILEKVLHTISQQQTSQTYKIVMAKFQQPLVPPATLTVHLSEKSENRFNFKARAEATVISTGIIEIKPESHDK
jgi:3-hydroxyacyl-[acyl-carrier-protein] dehydratase